MTYRNNIVLYIASCDNNKKITIVTCAVLVLAACYLGQLKIS